MPLRYLLLFEALLAIGKKQATLARISGRSVSAINRFVNINELKPPGLDVHRVRSLLRSGIPIKALPAELGVTRNKLYEFRRRHGLF